MYLSLLFAIKVTFQQNHLFWFEYSSRKNRVKVVYRNVITVKPPTLTNYHFQPNFSTWRVYKLVNLLTILHARSIYFSLK